MAYQLWHRSEGIRRSGGVSGAVASAVTLRAEGIEIIENIMKKRLAYQSVINQQSSSSGEASISESVSIIMT